MRTLLISGIYRPEIGGPATYVPALAQQLLSNQVPVEVITLKNSGAHTLIEPWKVSYINRDQFLFIRMIKTFITILRKAKLNEVIFANGLFQETALVLALVTRKSVAKIVGDPVWERAFNKSETTKSIVDFNKEKLRCKHKIQRVFLRWSLNRFDHVTCPSLELKEFITKWGVNRPIYFIPNGVEDTQRRQVETEYDLISVCRLVKWKNLDKLIIANADSKTKLAIVGDGPEEDNLKQIASSVNSNVVFLGKLTTAQVIDNLFKSKIFVLVSDYEGLSFSLLQAMACGLPSIVSNIQGNTDVIVDNQDGLIVNLKEDFALAQSIQGLVNDPEKLHKFGNSALNKVRNEYSQVNQISKMINLFYSKLTE
jgi:glycosyltransferase involved in cell wall biosynthesis